MKKFGEEKTPPKNPKPPNNLSEHYKKNIYSLKSVSLKFAKIDKLLHGEQIIEIGDLYAVVALR